MAYTRARAARYVSCIVVVIYFVVICVLLLLFLQVWVTSWHLRLTFFLFRFVDLFVSGFHDVSEAFLCSGLSAVACVCVCE